MRAILNGADVRDGVRYFTATVDEVRYDIPEAWSIGYCRTHEGATAIDAARAWHEQAVFAGAVVGALAEAFIGGPNA